MIYISTLLLWTLQKDTAGKRERLRSIVNYFGFCACFWKIWSC